MKRSVVIIYLGFTLAGLGLGIIETGKWLHTLAVPGSEWTPVLQILRSCIWLPAALITMSVISACHAIANTITDIRPGAVMVKSAFAAAIALVICWLTIKLSILFCSTPAIYIPVFTAALALCASMISYTFAPVQTRNIRTSIMRGAEIAVAWTALVVFMRAATDGSGGISFGGLGTFTALSYPPELREYPILIRDLAGGALFGIFAGIAVVWFVTHGSLRRGAVWGGFIGAWISGILYAAHSVIGTLIMQSAYSERIACNWTLLLIPAACLVTAFGLACILPDLIGRKQKIALTGTVIVLLSASAWYVADSRVGAKLYVAAVKAQHSNTRAYIQFLGDGGWRRTFEPHADNLKIALCDRLIKEHPRCIYTAHALFLKARCQFASWQFVEASNTLELLHERYLGFRGSSSLLLAHAYLAQGRFEKIALEDVWNDPAFAEWRSGDGLLMLGHAFEVVGNNQDALGQYSYYITALMGTRQNTWTTSAIGYAESRTDRMISNVEKPLPCAQVQGKVYSDLGPLGGIHIALVQPHIDASAPEDTKQFTGAQTVPYWFGLAATTGADGSFVFGSVPYGEYEVIVGYDVAHIFNNRVIASPIPLIKVDTHHLEIPAIVFSPNIKLIRPIGAITDNTKPTLYWEAYPGADHYSVSIISRPNLTQFAASGLASEGHQVWSRSNIKSASVVVTAEGFLANKDTEEYRLHSLVTNRYYSWLVLAFDKFGNKLSSSEHYQLDSEPVFMVKSDMRRGG